MQRCWAFRERVGPRILLLETVDYFGTSECFSENFDGEAINWSGVVNFHGMKMSLVMSMRFIFGDGWNDAPCSSRRFYFKAMISIFLHAYILKKIFFKYSEFIKFSEEHSTVDKVGRETF